MKLLIAGSRSIRAWDISDYVPPETDLIISGGAKGVDTLAEKYADERGIAKRIIRPQYELYGKAAPLKRNEQMVELADHVLILWDGQSRGTQYTMEYAAQKGKPVTIVLCSEE